MAVDYFEFPVNFRIFVLFCLYLACMLDHLFSKTYMFVCLCVCVLILSFSLAKEEKMMFSSYMVCMFVIFFKTEKIASFSLCVLCQDYKDHALKLSSKFKIYPQCRAEFTPTFSGCSFWWTCTDLFPYHFVQLCKALVITLHLQFSEPK